MAQSSSLREELLPLLIARIRVGTALVATSIVLYGTLELWLQRAALGPFFAVKAVQVAAVAIVWVALTRIRGAQWPLAVGLALALVVEVCGTLVVSGILAGDAASAPLLFILLTLGTATLLPWGIWPQAATVAVAAVSLMVNAWLVPVPDGFGYQAIAATMAFVASLVVAYQLELHRLQRHRAESEERNSASALREEIFVAEATAHAARELLAGCDTPQVPRRSPARRRLLHCDASYTFARVARSTAFVAVATARTAASQWASRRALRIPDIGLARMLDRLDRDEPVVMQDAPGMLPVDGRAGVYTALFAGRDVIGIQVAIRRQPEPFTSTEIELARRLAHTASAALAQAPPRDADASGTPAHLARAQTPLTSILRFAERASDSTLPTTERRTLVNRIARPRTRLACSSSARRSSDDATAAPAADDPIVTAPNRARPLQPQHRGANGAAGGRGAGSSSPTVQHADRVQPRDVRFVARRRTASDPANVGSARLMSGILHTHSARGCLRLG
jgi:hypothetical protein